MNQLKIPVFHQKKNDYACGPCCIKMVSDYFEKSIDYREIVKLTMNGKSKRKRGTSFHEMTTTIKKIGLKYKKIQGGIEKFDDVFKRRNPMILRCIMQDDEGRCPHYIVVTGKDKEYLYVSDPHPKGLKKVKISSFEKRRQRLNWGNKRWGIEVYE